MISEASGGFWACFNALPEAIQQRAALAFTLWRENQRHPSLQFMRKGPYWSVRITDDYRALGRQRDDTIIWFFIGDHTSYLRVLRGG